MIESKNIYFNEYLSVLFLLKLLAFLFLIFTSYTYDNLGVSVKFLENKKKVEAVWNFRFHRSLAKKVFLEQYDYKNMNDKLLKDRSKNDGEYGKNYVSPYEQTRKRPSNNVGVLQRNYKNNCGKKRGLAKWDHYFEKQIFHKLDDIYAFANKWNSEKKILKKIIFKKYGIRYILICSIPLLGLILPIIFGFIELKDGIFKWCGIMHEKHRHNHMGPQDICKLPYFNSRAALLSVCINNITFIIITIIILFMFFYTLKKIIKYERIKANKGKMSLKEYCNFCKDIIRKFSI
ncbi:hypothetical protein PVBG_06083 [Plasmodium vivax Brazil I]|uniref:Variable surface protein Vir35 n=1 Tax=Plasmodium vivax (strain Brazil I) TaxID=1033975 RepID=A0A0J9T0X5_PLAV1|nr:hypothetical protein PVBG_06083 [Plasmodium vivax Brazil I]